MAHDAQIAVFVVVLLIASAALALQLVLLWRKSRSVRASRRPGAHASSLAPKRTTVRRPIVLVPGWIGIDAVCSAGGGYEYFRGVRAELERAGQRVHVVQLSPRASIAQRAEQLAEQLSAIDCEYVNLVAHGIGGLDARYAITKLGQEVRALSLTTIGTPHWGTPLWLPDAALEGVALPRRVRASLRPEDGAAELAPEPMRAFNKAVPNVPGVVYGSYCAALPASSPLLHRALAPSCAWLEAQTGAQGGANDGIVAASAQRWGEVLGEIAADHWGQIGWSRGFDARRFYAELALSLAGRGF